MRGCKSFQIKSSNFGLLYWRVYGSLTAMITFFSHSRPFYSSLLLYLLILLVTFLFSDIYVSCIHWQVIKHFQADFFLSFSGMFISLAAFFAAGSEWDRFTPDVRIEINEHVLIATLLAAAAAAAASSLFPSSPNWPSRGIKHAKQARSAEP